MRIVASEIAKNMFAEGYRVRRDHHCDGGELRGKDFQGRPGVGCSVSTASAVMSYLAREVEKEILLLEGDVKET